MPKRQSTAKAIALEEKRRQAMETRRQNSLMEHEKEQQRNPKLNSTEGVEGEFQDRLVDDLYARQNKKEQLDAEGEVRELDLDNVPEAFMPKLVAKRSGDDDVSSGDAHSRLFEDSKKKEQRQELARRKSLKEEEETFREAPKISNKASRMQGDNRSMYERSMDKKRQAERAIEEKRKAELEEAKILAETTAPAGTDDITMTFEKRQEVYAKERERKEAKLEKMREEKRLKEEAECSFEPKIKKGKAPKSKNKYLAARAAGDSTNI